MEDQDDFKFKGAALKQAAAVEKAIISEHADDDASSEESGLIHESPDEAKASIDDTEGEKLKDQKAQQKRYRWCKCICDPPQYGRQHYFLHLDTFVSQWEEPSEPYWLFDIANQTIDSASGLQQSSTASRATTSSDAADPNYTGYNPKIHGNYDPNADYAQYHNKKREEESNAAMAAHNNLTASAATSYVASGAFNRFTGNFQSADKSTDRHSDYNKSGRQMGAYFDVDAAANAHDGRSLKEERRNQKLSKKQIKELAEHRRAKKEKKRMDFYKS